jgi:hypothetical protein
MKKQKFILYTNPNNVTNKGYVVIGTEDVKKVLRGAKSYPGSYILLYQGKGTQDDLVKAKQMFSNYSFNNESII